MKEEKDSENYLKCCIMNSCQEPGCDNYELRRDLIQKIIDGQASEEEQLMYEGIISKCKNCQCRQYCEQELAIKNLIQTKLDRKRVPLDILEEIKTKITKIS
jgi:hypothetical protein